MNAHEERIQTARNECPQHRHDNEWTSDLAVRIRALELEDAWQPMYVNPQSGHVRRATDEEARLLPDEVLWHESGTTSTDRPVDFHHVFDPAEFLLACHWQWWLEDQSLIADGVPFLALNIEVTLAEPDEDDEDPSPVGWALVLHRIPTT